jgi:hypothetical protein
MHDLHKDLHTPQDLQTHQDLLSDPTIGVNHDPSSIGVYESNHVHAGFDGHNFADYQPHHTNGLLDDQYSQVGHTSHLEHSFQNQHLADYQSNHANSLLDHHHFADSHHSQSLVDSHFDHLLQRSGAEKPSELLSRANDLEKKGNESLSSSQDHSKNADWHREHKNQSDVASYEQRAQNAMAESEKYKAEAKNLREQAKTP